MSDTTTRTIVIATNILITIVIVSLIFGMFGKMKEIYGIARETDNSISASFDSVYETYNGKKENGLGLLNTIKKYEDDPKSNIKIVYPGCETVRALAKTEGKREAVILKNSMEGIETRISGYSYEKKYNVRVVEDQTQEAVYIITFE